MKPSILAKAHPHGDVLQDARKEGVGRESLLEAENKDTGTEQKQEEKRQAVRVIFYFGREEKCEQKICNRRPTRVAELI